MIIDLFVHRDIFILIFQSTQISNVANIFMKFKNAIRYLFYKPRGMQVKFF